MKARDKQVLLVLLVAAMIGVVTIIALAECYGSTTAKCLYEAFVACIFGVLIGCVAMMKEKE